jgi:trimeric autotransporter adhesin
VVETSGFNDGSWLDRAGHPHSESLHVTLNMRKTCCVLTVALALAHTGFGQGYTISSIVGAGWDIPGLSASLSQMEGLATDGAGNVFLALTNYSVVLRLDTSGQLSLVAGNGIAGFSGDGGPAALAQLSGPTGIAMDSAGNVYIEDAGNGRIRMVSNGVITTVAGGGTGDDGPATSARLNFNFIAPGIAVDSSGSIYFADYSDLYRIRKVSNGILSTLAGGGFSVSDNIPATSASISAQGVAVDSAGNVYFADTCAQRIRKVSNGTITTVAGNGQENFDCAAAVSGPATGNATSVGLDSPRAVVVDPAGNLYFTEGGAGPFRVRKVSNGNISIFAGGNEGVPCCPNYGDNISATSATLEFFSYISIALDTAGNLYIPDEYAALVYGGYYAGTDEDTPAFGRLRKVSSGVITTIAGSSVDSGPAATAQLNLPGPVAVDSAGNVYIGDASNTIVREVSNETITTIAGTRPFSGGCGCDSGPPLGVLLGDPLGVAVDSSGNVYIADGDALELSQGVVVPLRVITPLQGTGVMGTSVALDSAGNLYFANWSGNQIQELSNGMLTTIAGTGAQGFSGDNGPATSAELSGPSGIAVDGVGNIYFADTGNQRVRKISNGTIMTVAGNGTAGFSGDNGPATGAQLNLQQGPLVLPSGIAVDASGNFFIVDSGNQRVRMVSNGAITTIAGTGSPGFSGDGGPAVSAQLNNPSGIAVDMAGKVYISDSSNGRIRVLTSGCTFNVSPLSVTAPASGGSFPITIQTSPSCSWSIAGLPSWITTLASPSPSAGPVTVILVVAANAGANRTASLMIGGKTVSITQAGANVCTYTVGPSLVELPPSGGTFTITVQTGVSCAWSITGLPAWIILPSGLPPLVGSASFVLTVAATVNTGNIAHLIVAGQAITVTQGPAPGSGPVITSVTTAGSEIPVIAPNTWVEIKGPFLGLPGDNRTWQSSDFANNQMPTALDSIGVTMNGESAYVYYISFNQINVLTPPDLALGPVQVVVTVSTVSSPAFTSQAEIESPSLFVLNGGPYAAAVHANGSVIGPTTLYPGLTTPAQPGETIELFANGFGPINVPVVKGAISQSGTLSPLPTISIGGVNAVVSFAGLVSPGEFQFNVAVPPSLADGDQLIVVTYGGQTTQPGTLITVHD